MDGFLSGPQTWFATEVVVITDGWSRRSFVPLAIKSHSAWCCWMKISCAPCPLLWIAGACRADLLEQQNFCYYWRRQVANHLGWKERRGEGDVDDFNAEMNRVLWEKVWLDPLTSALHRGSWDDTFWAPIQAPLPVLIQPCLASPSKFLEWVGTHLSGSSRKGKGQVCGKKWKDLRVEAPTTAEIREFTSA